MSLRDWWAGRSIAQASRECALVWAIFGIVETSLLAVRPWLFRDLLAAHVPWLIGSAKGPGIGFTGVALVVAVYPLAGATFGAIVSLVVASTAVGRRALAAAHGGTLWSSVGSLSCVLLFGSNALLRNQRFALSAVAIPLGLAAAGLASAWRPAWRSRLVGLTGPWLMSTLLVGEAYIVQPRADLSVLTRGLAGLVFLGGVLAVALVLRRLLTGAWWWLAPSNTGRTASFAGTALAAACVLFSQAMVRGGTPQRNWPTGGPHSSADRPNVILIVLDTVRADHLSLYGYQRNTTPHLQQWSAAGFVTYRTAFASSNHTLPAHASIFTGLNPHRHGAQITDLYPTGLPIAAEVATLPAILAGQGYLTVGIVANAAYLRPELGFGRGFAGYESELPQQTFGATPPYLPIDFLHRLVATMFRSADTEPAFYNAGAVNKQAFSFLDAAGGPGGPFFLFLNYMDAHAPYVPPPPFDTRYGGASASFRWLTYPELAEDVSVHRTRTLDASTRAHLESQYDGAIAYLDQELAGLFLRLQTLGLYDNTLIIVTSDHGEGFGERSLVGHGLSVYQQEVHVPLIVKYPHARTGTVVDAPVSIVDLLPTVLDVIGARAPPDLDGVSLQHAAPRWVVAESSRLIRADSQPGILRPAETALVWGSLKLIGRADGRTELYDLAKDPLELTDVFGKMGLPEGWRAMMARLTAADPGSMNRLPVDPVLLERLRSLGYVR